MSAQTLREQASFPEGAVELTPSQKQMVELIALKALDRASNGGLSEAEIKRFEVRELWTGRYTTISVLIEAGHVDDENDLRSVFCRTKGHFFIGSHGGVEIAGLKYDSDFDGKRSRARKHPLIYGFRS